MTSVALPWDAANAARIVSFSSFSIGVRPVASSSAVTVGTRPTVSATACRTRMGRSSGVTIEPLATTPSLQQIEARDCRAWLGEVASRYPYVASLSVTSNAGEVLCSYPVVPSNFHAPRSALRDRAMARDAFVMGYVERGAITGQPVLGALEPIRDGNRRIGFVGASITVQQLNQLLNRGRALDGARAAIVDSTGRIVADSAPPTGHPDIGLPTAAQIRNHLGPEPEFVEVQNGDAVVLPLHAPDLYAVMAWAPEQSAWRRWGEIARSLD